MSITTVEFESEASREEQEQVFEWLLSLLTRDGDVTVEPDADSERRF